MAKKIIHFYHIFYHFLPFFTTEVYKRVRRGREHKPSGLHCREHDFLLYVANAEVICENSWSNRKLSNLYKIL